MLAVEDLIKSGTRIFLGPSNKAYITGSNGEINTEQVST